jgi:Cu/Ag efflux pump CusA
LLELRTAFVAALTIALSFAAALLLLQLLGQTLNALVVLGLLVASVALVDDAVGGAHELLRAARNSPPRSVGYLKPNGKRPLPATLVDVLGRTRGTLGYATLMVLLVAAPVYFSSGLTARYLHPMLLALALAVLCSALIAVTVAPALGLLLLEGRPPLHRLGAQLGRELTDRYERLLRAALRLPFAALAAVGLIGLAGLVAIPFLHRPAAPRFQDRNLVVQWTGPASAGLGEMDRVTGLAVKELRALPGVADVAATLGRAVSGDRIVDPNSGQMFVALKPRADYNATVGQVKQVVQRTPGIDASVSTYETDLQAGVLKPASDAITVRVYGEDYGELRAIAVRIERRMAVMHGMGAPHIEAPARQPNIEIAVNDDAAHNAGVLPGDARRQASTLVSGLTVGNFFQDQAVFDVVVIGTPAVRSNLDQIGHLLIDNAGGGQVRLSRIARVAVRPDPIDIRHQALSRYVDVVAPVRDGALSSAQAAIEGALARMPMPLTYHAEVLAGTPEDATSHGLFLTFVLATALGVLLLLQAAFASWRLAATVLATLPLALVGGLIVALATGQFSALGADAGLLAVLLFALRHVTMQGAALRRLHSAQGGELRTAHIVRAARTRFAPTMMAISVSAAGLIPFIALGDIPGNELLHTAAAVTLGGLLSTALWALVLVPALCSYLAPLAPELAEEPLDGLDPVSLAASSPSLALKGNQDA